MAETFIKRLELAVRRRYNRWVSRGEDPIVVTQPLANAIVSDTARILLLRQDRIGDVLVSTPIIAELRARFPRATIDMVLSTNNVAVRFAIEPYVDHLHVFRKGLIDLLRLRQALRRAKYDVVIDLMDNASSTSGILIQGSRAPLAIGVDKENRRVYTHVVPLADRTVVHIVERIACVVWPLGFDIPHTNLRPRLPDVGTQTLDRGRGNPTYVLGVNISGSDVDRMYPEDQLKEVLGSIRAMYAEELQKGTFEIILMSAPHHNDIAKRIGQSLGMRVLDPMPSFRAFANAIGHCDMFFTPDTSAVHVAAAFNVPSLVLFAQDDRKLMPWYPYATRCWSCIAHNAPLAAIPPIDIIAQLQTMICEISGMKPKAS